MPKTNLLREDWGEYEGFALAYQCVLIAALDAALKQNGIDDGGIRQKICEDFTFDMGNLHDQNWFKVGNERVFPLLCFAKKFLDIDTPVDELGVVWAPAKHCALHEYAIGNVGEYFEGNPTTLVERGGVAEMDT